MPEISAVGILRQDDCQFETNLGYIQKKNPVKNKKQKQKTPPQKQGRRQRTTPKAVPIYTTNQNKHKNRK